MIIFMSCEAVVADKTHPLPLLIANPLEVLTELLKGKAEREIGKEG